MSKSKPRHNPYKKQNNYGSICPYYETYDNGASSCEALIGGTSICKGNRHNCIKVKYKKLAICSTKNPRSW